MGFPPQSVKPAGFVLAGGRSRRMGSDKALLPWGATTLLDHAVQRLDEVCESVRILCGAQPRYADRGLPLLLDAGAGGDGPLAGLLAGLRALGPHQAGLFLAVDLPTVPATLLAQLATLAADADAVVPVTERGPEPLCALYRASCEPPVARRLATGERHMTCFWPDVRVHQVTTDELQRFGDPKELFHNVNAPSDYGHASLSPQAEEGQP